MPPCAGGGAAAGRGGVSLAAVVVPLMAIHRLASQDENTRGLAERVVMIAAADGRDQTRMCMWISAWVGVLCIVRPEG